jgi:hypothetical protein
MASSFHGSRPRTSARPRTPLVPEWWPRLRRGYCFPKDVASPGWAHFLALAFLLFIFILLQLLGSSISKQKSVRSDLSPTARQLRASRGRFTWSALAFGCPTVPPPAWGGCRPESLPPRAIAAHNPGPTFSTLNRPVLSAKVARHNLANDSVGKALAKGNIPSGAKQELSLESKKSLDNIHSVVVKYNTTAY